MKLPNWKDPRWTLLGFLACFVGYSIYSSAFHRTPGQFAAAFLTCLGLDLLLQRFYKKVSLFPLSAIITSCGTLLLTDSPYVWPYALVAALSILSKHFITIRGRHVFNPNNFGLVIALLFLSNDITTEAGRWGGHTVGAILIFMLGLFVVHRAGKLPLALAYMITFIIGAYVRSLIFGRYFIMTAAPVTGAGFQLFVFYMISDPKTSPRSVYGQIIFGALLSILDSYLRMHQVKYAPFYSLFIMTALYSYLIYEPIHWEKPLMKVWNRFLRRTRIHTSRWRWVILAVFSFALGFAAKSHFAKREAELHFQKVSQKFGEARRFALPLNNPDTVSVKEAVHMKDDDIIFGIVVNGHPRAYPRWLMIAYHVANDTIEDEPVMLAQCEVCSSAAAFNPLINEPPYGPLVFSLCGFYGGTFQICDNFTNSKWRPFAGVAFAGPLTEKKLKTRIPVQVEKWGEWKRRFPTTDVVFASTNIKLRPHSRGPKFDLGVSYIPNFMAVTADLTDKRLPDNELVFGIYDGGNDEAVAFPLARLDTEPNGVVYSFRDQRVVIAKRNQFDVVAFTCRKDSVCKVKSRNPLLFSDDDGGLWDETGRALRASKIRQYLEPADGYFAEWYEWVNTHSNSKIYGLVAK